MHRLPYLIEYFYGQWKMNQENLQLSKGTVKSADRASTAAGISLQ